MDNRSVPPALDRRAFLGLLGKGVAGAVALGAGVGLRVPEARSAPALPPFAVSVFDPRVPVAWFGLALDLVRDTAGFTPPVAARAFGYAGVALYEALVAGMSGHRSLAGQLNGLPALPRPPGGPYHWPAVANGALASIFRSQFASTTARAEANAAAIGALEQSFADGFGPMALPGHIREAAEYGRSVAEAVHGWSLSDGGHEGHLRNFPEDYRPPEGPGLWVPTPPNYSPALQPYWGRNRPFAMRFAGEHAPGDHPPYSEEEGSTFHAEASEVRRTVDNITEEQREIALYWADVAGETSTPPGHSVSILNQLMTRPEEGSTSPRRRSLALAAEAYAKLGIALSDAFVSCWHTKYEYNLLRPITYVRRVMDPAWGDSLPVATPPFPEYTSGHSVQSGAAARVLTDLFGDVPFTDHTHDGRGFAPRSFGSFSGFAQEAAISRLYGGIHYRSGVERGLEQGERVARRVLDLRFLR